MPASSVAAASSWDSRKDDMGSEFAIAGAVRVLCQKDVVVHIGSIGIDAQRRRADTHLSIRIKDGFPRITTSNGFDGYAYSLTYVPWKADWG